MIINEQVKGVIEGSAFIALVSMNGDGTPHPIIAGKGAVDDDNVVFGIYKMEQTQKNIAANANVAVVACTFEGGKPAGYRLSGTACAKDKQLVFTATKVEALI